MLGDNRDRVGLVPRQQQGRGEARHTGTGQFVSQSPVRVRFGPTHPKTTMFVMMGNVLFSDVKFNGMKVCAWNYEVAVDGKKMGS